MKVSQVEGQTAVGNGVFFLQEISLTGVGAALGWSLLLEIQVLSTGKSNEKKVKVKDTKDWSVGVGEVVKLVIYSDWFLCYYNLKMGLGAIVTMGLHLDCFSVKGVNQ